jgi:6-phosphogluconolactonase
VTVDAAGTAELRIVGSSGEAAIGAADAIVEALVAAVGARGVAHWATTGGSTAPALYAALSEPARRDAIPWGSVHVWWGDERYVPFDHPLSNALPFDQRQGHDLPIPSLNVHRVPTAEALDEGRGAAWAAARYGVDLQEAGLADGSTPGALDVVLLGIGPDGHLLSVFPGSAVWDTAAAAAAVPAPTHIEPHVERVTLHPSYLAAARRIVVVATGAAKAEALGRAWTPATDVRETPARAAVRPGAIWFVDEAAAARIPR